MRQPPALRTPRIVQLCLGAAVLLFAGYALHAAANVGGDSLDPLFEKWINDAVPILCALVCIARAWRSRVERAAWLLMGLGIVFWAAGNVYYSIYVIDVVPLPVPSVADGLWLAQYPLSLVAVLLLMRSRLSGGGVRAWLDGSIAGLALAAISAAIVLPAVLGASGGSMAGLLTNVAYPVGDMVLLGSVGAALAVGQFRLDRMWTSLALGFIAFCAADGYFLVKTAEGTYAVGTIADAGWLLGGVLIALAAWRPVGRQGAARAGVSAILLPSAFGAVALVLLVWDHYERLTTIALVLSSACVVAVLARMTFAFAENLGMLARLRLEAQNLAVKNEQLLEVDQLKEKLRQSQKMEALGQLAGGVAHDFNNLLTVVMGYTSLLRPRLVADPSAETQLDAIETATERATDLTRQLLTFSHRQVVDASIVDLNEVVSETEVMIASALGADIRLVTDLSPERPAVQADRGQISQVLVNLVLNGRDAMPEGGTITITTHGDASDGFVTLSIADTGVGMDTSTQERIFEPFFTTKGKSGGSGLGLASVYGIVDRAGGSVEVDSAPGTGSTFRIALPAATTHEPPEGATPPTFGEAAVLPKEVLLVEDERAVRELLVEQLESLGHLVSAAPTPARALELFEERATTIDLVITDVVMPGMNGWELSNCLRERRPDLPVVLISGYTGGAFETSDVTGPTALLQKPFTIGALSAKMESVVERAELSAGALRRGDHHGRGDGERGGRRERAPRAHELHEQTARKG